MPRRRRNKTMKGGFLDTLSGWGSSISEGASSLWGKTKQSASSLTGTYSTPSYSAPTTYTPPPPPAQPSAPVVGGKYRRSKRRRMRGGFSDNTPTTGLAAHAASFSGQTAQPHNWVGGKTRRRKHRRGSKSKRHRRH